MSPARRGVLALATAAGQCRRRVNLDLLQSCASAGSLSCASVQYCNCRTAPPRYPWTISIDLVSRVHTAHFCEFNSLHTLMLSKQADTVEVQYLSIMFLVFMIHHTFCQVRFLICFQNVLGRIIRENSLPWITVSEPAACECCLPAAVCHRFFQLHILT
jgi:hypothetical protein